LNQQIRRQLTLFVNPTDAQEIEAVRKKFNPQQQALIDCHVTLCREDEIDNIEAILANLQKLDSIEISISFGRVIRFDNNKGVMLPAVGEKEGFHGLRSKILAGIHETIRRPEPHITLMHPRNSSCTDEIFEEIQKLHFPSTIVFTQISLIEQIDGGKWSVLQEFPSK
jgi:2'-5' RNA ligase